MEEGLRLRGDVYKGGCVGCAERVTQNIAYNPSVFACEVPECEGSLFTREVGEVAGAWRDFEGFGHCCKEMGELVDERAVIM